MYAIKVTSPDYTLLEDDEEVQRVEGKGFLFPVEPGMERDYDHMVYMIFMIDSQFGHQTDCPRKFWRWEAITVLGDQEIKVRDS